MRKRPSKTRLLRIIAKSRVSKKMKALARAGVREFYEGRLRPVQGLMGSRSSRCACLVGAALLAETGYVGSSITKTFGVKNYYDLMQGFDSYEHVPFDRSLWNRGSYRLGRALAKEIFRA